MGNASLQGTLCWVPGIGIVKMECTLYLLMLCWIQSRVNYSLANFIWWPPKIIIYSMFPPFLSSHQQIVLDFPTWLRHVFPTSFTLPIPRITARALANAVSPAARVEWDLSANMALTWRDKHLGRGPGIWAGRNTVKHYLYNVHKQLNKTQILTQ